MYLFPMTANMPSERKDTYHHGNLRESLLTTALDFLETGDLEKLSLRALAKRVGVSPTAVYSHFTDKTELLIDVRTRGFRLLSEYLNQALAQAPEASGEQKVRILGVSYMTFALQKPHLFDALFSWTPDLSRMKEDCIEAGVDSVEILRQAILEMLTEQGLPSTEYLVSVASLSAWSLVHGLTSLVKAGSIEGAVHCGHWPAEFSAQQPQAQQRIFEHILTIEIEGVKAAAAQISP